jgi:hypothetical protein
VVVHEVAVVVVDVVVMVVLKSDRVETELVVVVSSRQPHQPGVLHVDVRVVLVEVEELDDVVVSEWLLS